MGRWIIWPQTAFVNEQKLRGWFSDAIANEEIEFDGDPNTVELNLICNMLGDAGLVTFAREGVDLTDQARAEAAQLEAEYGP